MDTGARLVAIRILYLVLVPIALLTFTRGVAVRFPTYLANQVMLQGARELGLQWAPFAYVVVSAATIASAVLIVVGALIARRLWGSPFGVFLSLTAMLTAATLGPLPVLIHTERDPVWWSLTALVVAAAASSGYIFLCVFPSGRFVPTWSRGLAAAAIAYGPMGVWLSANEPAGTPISLLGDLLFLGSGLAAQVYRYRRVSSPRERHQTKWVMYGLSLVVAAWLVQHLPPEITPELGEPGAPRFVFVLASDVLFFSSFVILAGTLAVAILRERLLGVDLVVNRTLAYGGISVVLAAVFGALTLIGQRLTESVTGERSDLVTLVTALAVVLAFSPLRTRARGLVDRFLPPREYLTLLFTDIVSSTETLVELGDEGWRGTLGRYRGAVRSELKRFHGREVDTAGDSFFATFGDATRAVHCAVAIRMALRGLGLQSRTGLHSGECEMRGETVTGINVHVAARVMASALPGDILVSSAVRELAAPSGVEFGERGTHTLKGIPHAVRLYAVAG